MRSPALILTLAISLALGCVVRRAGDVPAAAYDAGAQPITAIPAPAPAPEPAAESKPDDVFATTVRPILVQRCSPCHEPGGTMYDKLPFDQPTTLRTHRDGALKRFSGLEKQALEAWFSSSTP